MVAHGTGILTSTIPKCSFSPTAAMPFCKRTIAARPVSASSSLTPATFKLGLGWWKMLSMQRVGLWIKGLRIQNGSQRWEDRWEVSPRCARWKCGPISFGAALMNLGPPTRRWACVYFPNIGQTLLHVGVGVREMSITTRTGIEKFRRFTMSMRSALHF